MDSCDSSTDKRLDASENGYAGESKLHVSSSSSSSSVVHWSPEDVEAYCKLCIELNEKGLPTDDTDEWIVIINKFEKLYKKYGRAQLLSKLKNLEEEWKNWKQLLYKETGLGWNPSKKTIDGSNEWWEKKIQANPKLKPFRREGIHPDLEVLLDKMFEGTTDTRDITWSTNEDMEGTQLHSSDGTGSADENLRCEIDEKIVESNEGSGHKRVAQSHVRETRRKKEKKLTGAAKSPQQLDKISSADESSSTAASQRNEGLGSTYKELIQLMDTIPEIRNDEQLQFFALDLFLEMKDNREIFMNLKSNERRVAWLKYKFAKVSHR